MINNGYVSLAHAGASLVSSTTKLEAEVALIFIFLPTKPSTNLAKEKFKGPSQLQMTLNCIIE